MRPDRGLGCAEPFAEPCMARDLAKDLLWEASYYHSRGVLIQSSLMVIGSTRNPTLLALHALHTPACGVCMHRGVEYTHVGDHLAARCLRGGAPNAAPWYARRFVYSVEWMG